MGLFGKILKGTIDVVSIPVAIVKDVATLGGAMTEKRNTYTGDSFRQLNDTCSDIYDSLDDD